MERMEYLKAVLYKPRNFQGFKIAYGHVVQSDVKKTNCLHVELPHSHSRCIRLDIPRFRKVNFRRLCSPLRNPVYRSYLDTNIPDHGRSVK